MAKGYSRVSATTRTQKSANPLMPSGGSPSSGSRNGGGGSVARETGKRDTTQNDVPRTHSYSTPSALPHKTEIPCCGGVAGGKAGGSGE